MKKIIFGVIGILTITLIIYMVLLNYNEEYQFKKKMRKSGYNDEEIITVMEMIPKKDYDIILKREYNDSLIDIISSDDFKENYLDMYLDYYEKTVMKIFKI